MLRPHSLVWAIRAIAVLMLLVLVGTMIGLIAGAVSPIFYALLADR